jgi:hypothetical protein
MVEKNTKLAEGGNNKGKGRNETEEKDTEIFKLNVGLGLDWKCLLTDFLKIVNVKKKFVTNLIFYQKFLLYFKFIN